MDRIWICFRNKAAAYLTLFILENYFLHEGIKIARYLENTLKN